MERLPSETICRVKPPPSGQRTEAPSGQRTEAPCSSTDPPRPIIGIYPVTPKGISDESVGGTGLLKKVGDLTFSSAFDSANLKDVAQGSDGEYHLWTACDCEGSKYQSRNASWFHFSVSGASANTKSKFRIVNMNRQPGLYKFGFRPVVKSVPSRPTWERVKSELQYGENDEGKFEISWQHTFHKEGDEVFFAFCYPYSYSECQEDLANLERRLSAPPPKVLPYESIEAARAANNDDEWPKKPQKEKELPPWDCWRKPPWAHADPNAIFFHRELLTRSLDGRRIDLITISDWRGIDEEGGVCESHSHLSRRLGTASVTPLHSSVFPEVGTGRRPHAPKFGSRKPVVFLSARVHPGETPASFCMNGVLEFLTNPSDARAIALRRNFVFKLVPILNPDGVARGHYRMDNFGRNLNRYYQDPSPDEQPTIYAAKKAALMHAFMPEPELVAGGLPPDSAKKSTIDPAAISSSLTTMRGSVSNGRRGSKPSNNQNDKANDDADDGDDESQDNMGNRGGNLALYVDLHAHATKRGCFIYGNALDSLTDQTENQLYALLLSINTAHFEYDACNFSAKHMARVDKGDGMSAEGSGRVSLMADSGLVHSYTLECNYNTGKALNHVPAAQGGHQGRASPERTVTSPPKYAPEHWMEVGRAVLVALLDLREMNPWSRVGNSKYRTVDRARTSVCAEIRQRPPFQKQSLDRRFSERQERHAAEARAKKLQRAQDIRDDEARGNMPESRTIAGDLRAKNPKGCASSWSKGSNRFGPGNPHSSNSNLGNTSSSGAVSSSGVGESANVVVGKQSARAQRIAAASAIAHNKVNNSMTGRRTSVVGNSGKRSQAGSRKRLAGKSSRPSFEKCVSSKKFESANLQSENSSDGEAKKGLRPETSMCSPENTTAASNAVTERHPGGAASARDVSIAGDSSVGVVPGTGTIGRKIRQIVPPKSFILQGQSSGPKKPAGKANGKGHSRGAKLTRIPRLKKTDTSLIGAASDDRDNDASLSGTTNPILPLMDGNSLPYQPSSSTYRINPPLSAGRKYVLG